MSSVNKLKTQIENANALGRQNLADKGVEVFAGATTYDIMSLIADISTGDASLPTPATTLQTESYVTQVILPVIVPTETVEINSNLVADSSAGLEV